MSLDFVARDSPNWEPRPAGQIVDMLVIHYTGMESADAALDRLCDPIAKVSAHYLIDEDGTVVVLVDEDRRAWHAGVACWRGEHDINSRSIGIELVNPGHEFGYRAFPDRQMDALARLARDIIDRHPVPARNVVGHADVAPRRKQDPGELFDWRTLARAGVGLWPAKPKKGKAADMIGLLARYGYDVSDPAAAITAFQRHFRQGRVDGKADAEGAGIAAALSELAA